MLAVDSFKVKIHDTGIMSLMLYFRLDTVSRSNVPCVHLSYGNPLRIPRRHVECGASRPLPQVDRAEHANSAVTRADA